MINYIYLNDELTPYIIDSRGFVINTQTNRVLLHSHNHKGYKMVTMHHKGKAYTKTIHKLVASYFIPNPFDLPVINHKDGNKLNNDVSNLEWCTSQQNTQHAWKNGLAKPLVGNANGCAKYTDNQIGQVCELLEKRISPRNISDITKVPMDTIRKILIRKEWKHISKRYNFDIEYFDNLNSVFNKYDKALIKIILEMNVSMLPKEICELINIPYTNSARKSIRAMQKCIINKSSTTIENDEYYTIDIH